MLRIAAAVLLCLTALAALGQNHTLTGQVTAVGRVAVADAEVSLIAPPQLVVASTRSGADGSFRFSAVAPGSYLLRVHAKGFAENRIPVQVGADTAPVTIDLAVAAVPQEITVTAERGVVEETHAATQQVNVITPSELAIRAKSVTAQAVQEEEGVQLQRTSPTISGVFVRGLTGNRVNVYVDGVRYSTSAQRGGINTFFNMNQAGGLDSIEILRGGSSAQYGSDAIGGTVQ